MVFGFFFLFQPSSKLHKEKMMNGKEKGEKCAIGDI